MESNLSRVQTEFNDYKKQNENDGENTEVEKQSLKDKIIGLEKNIEVLKYNIDYTVYI